VDYWTFVLPAPFSFDEFCTVIKTKQMKLVIVFSIAFALFFSAFSQTDSAQESLPGASQRQTSQRQPNWSRAKLSRHEISINGFRNPSIGAEYRYGHLSIHAGYYPTNFKAGETTEFIKSGLTWWFLPVGRKDNPSSFYGSLSYARGLTREYKKQNAVITEAGFRWMVYKGLNVRLGLAALISKRQPMQINPTPGLSYSIFFH
jgi:hypothetical protein